MLSCRYSSNICLCLYSKHHCFHDEEKHALTFSFLSLPSSFTTNPVGPVWWRIYAVACSACSIRCPTTSGQVLRKGTLRAIFFCNAESVQTAVTLIQRTTVSRIREEDSAFDLRPILVYWRGCKLSESLSRSVHLTVFQFSSMTACTQIVAHRS